MWGPTAKARPIGLICLLVGLSLSLNVAGTPKREPSPHFHGDVLPVPPQQRDPWPAPHEHFSEPWLNAVATLFEQGLADPRGCEYREVQIAVGSVWSGDGGVKSVHAWILPATVDADQRFAICWNGLVYPVIGVGDVADLHADVAEMIKSRAHLIVGAVPETESVSHTRNTLLRIAMLLRLKEDELARELLATREKPIDDPYLEIAREWTWSLFDRAVCAHMRGDDRLAFLSAHLLSEIQPLVEQTAEQRGFARPRTVHDEDGPYFGFLRPLPALLADSRRRVSQPAPQRVLDAGVEAFPDKAQRIAALIRDLEEVAERQWGQPGGVSIASSPIVRALEAEGDDAVEPLLDCLEHDERLTRSVSFGRDFHTGRTLIPVRSAAYAALTHILQFSTFGEASGGDSGGSDAATHQKRVREARDFWNRTKGMSPPQRWYLVLADDSATRKQWLEAAGRIVQPTDVESRGGWVTVPQRKPGEKPVFRGEILREKINPSVSELLARRVPAMNRTGERLSSAWTAFAANDATRMALVLDRWDPQAAAPVLRAQLEYVLHLAQRWKRSETDQHLANDIGRLTSAIAKYDEHEALASYARWIRVQTRESFSLQNTQPFEPLWQNPQHQELAEAAQWLFNNTSSPWRTLLRMDEPPVRDAMYLLRTPLVGLPSMRTHVFRNLADTTPYTTAEITENRSVSVRPGYSTSMRYPNDPQAPPVGEKVTVRVCDMYARELSKAEGTPLFELYWPLEKRDHVIDELRDFLARYGERYQFRRQYASLYTRHGSTLRMNFDPLDRPATEDDVRAGRAIFSLGNDAEVRAVPIELPFGARWKTFAQFPTETVRYDPETREPIYTIRYDRDGIVWQAEEVLENGQWVRYYGFVGRYIIAKVPADEIEVLPHLP